MAIDALIRSPAKRRDAAISEIICGNHKKRSNSVFPDLSKLSMCSHFVYSSCGARVQD